MTTDYSVTSCIEINVNSERTLNLISSYKFLQSKKSIIYNFTFKMKSKLFKTKNATKC